MIANRTVHVDGWGVTLDLTRQVLHLEAPEDIAEWDDGGRRPAGTPLWPVLAIPDGGPVSAATLLLKAKQFDDRLYAAVELAAQRGAGRFAGKAALLRSLAGTLAAGLPDSGIGAATLIHAACELGGVPVAVPEAVVEAVRSARADFLGDDLKSKPLAFYTWTPELSAIFRQDRFLQEPLDPDTADALNRALDADARGIGRLRRLSSLERPAHQPAEEIGHSRCRETPALLSAFPLPRGHPVRAAVRGSAHPRGLRPDGGTDPPSSFGRDQSDARRTIRLV